MTGNDKIIERILAASENAAAAKSAEAEKTAEKQLAEEKAVLAEKAAAAAVLREQAGERQLSAARSAAELAVRNAQLECRRAEIDRTLADTLAHLRALPTEEYFALLSTLIRTHRDEEGGELLLSAADLQRVPNGFAASLGVTLSKTPAAIDGGCILRFGDIEENLTFEALLNDRRDRLEDTIYQELWSE